MAKGKRGRPKKEGERYPCGKLKKPGGETITGAAWQRIRTDAVKLTKDPRLATEVGRLSFHGELTDRQVSAALRIAQIYGAFEAPHSLRRNARSPSYEIGIRGAAVHGSDQPEAERDFLDLQEQIPYSMRAIIEQLCVENRAVSSLCLDEIRWALNHLADTFKRWDQRAKKKTRTLNMAPVVQAAPAKKAAQKSTKSPHFDRPFAQMTVLDLFPDLDTDQINLVIAYRHALKDRAIYRNEASVRGHGKRNLSSENIAA